MASGTHVYTNGCAEVVQCRHQKMSMRFGMYTEVNYIMVLLLFDVLPLQLSGTMRNTRGQGLGILNVTSYMYVLTSH